MPYKGDLKLTSLIMMVNNGNEISVEDAIKIANKAAQNHIRFAAKEEGNKGMTLVLHYTANEINALWTQAKNHLTEQINEIIEAFISLLKTCRIECYC